MYSQNDEEKIILEYFSKDKIEDLKVLDIGANDGITFSNSYELIKRGATGYLIEASKKTFKKMIEVHQNTKGKVYGFNYAIADKNGYMKFYESGTLINKDDHSLVSTLKPKEMDRWKSTNIDFKEETVLAKTFKTFIKECNDKYFDLITIDIEGYDWDVLTQIDLKAVKCQMLIVEWNTIEEVRTKFIDYARIFDMKLISSNPENLIFVK
jgi:FkbM family methyltransferase